MSSHIPTPSSPASRLQRSRVMRLILAVAVTVPLVFSALYMWVMWDPTETIDEMPVAIVNADRPFGEGPSRVEAGAGVAQNLIDSGALDFESVDHDTALAGLKDGSYYFVVEIPENFSETLAQIGGTANAPALINVVYNDYNTLKASAIGAAAMSSINSAVLQGVASTTVGTVLTGVDTLGSGLKTAAIGSEQLSDGTKVLQEGVAALTDGIDTQLTPGVDAAATGSTQVAAGAGELSTGLASLQTGTTQLGDGATQVADGIDQLVGGIDPGALVAQIKEVEALLPPGSGLSDIATVLTGLQSLQAGSREVANQLSDPTADYRSGVDQLVTGGQQLSVGTTQLASGMQTLSTGMTSLSEGAHQLRDGSTQLDAGATQLNDGLTAGAEQAPDLGDQTQRETLATLISTPVTSHSDNLAPAQFAGPGAAPLMLIFASALVVIVVLLCFRGHGYLTGSVAPPTVREVVRRALAVCSVSLAVMLVFGIGLWIVLSPAPSPASLWQVVVIVASSTVMNVAVVSIFFTVFGYGAGALTALAWTMLQLFAYGGIWMVETLPAPLRWLHPLVPMSYTRDGLIAAFNGTTGFVQALTAIMTISLIAAAVIFGIVHSVRKRFDQSDRGADGGDMVSATSDRAGQRGVIG